jgi:hypothetical protein
MLIFNNKIQIQMIFFNPYWAIMKEKTHRNIKIIKMKFRFIMDNNSYKAQTKINNNK